jgi:hypothetical protein
MTIKTGSPAVLTCHEPVHIMVETFDQDTVFNFKDGESDLS